MNIYELTLILRINDGLDTTKETVANILQKHGVEIKSTDEWGRRRLAYTIDRMDDGHYILYTINASPDTVKKMTAEFRLNQDILRYLFIRPEEPKKTEEPKTA